LALFQDDTMTQVPESVDHLLCLHPTANLGYTPLYSCYPKLSTAPGCPEQFQEIADIV
jgi:hypothetical protein